MPDEEAAVGNSTCKYRCVNNVYSLLAIMVEWKKGLENLDDRRYYIHTSTFIHFDTPMGV